MTFVPATRDTLLVLDNDVLTHWRNQHAYPQLAIGDYFAYHKRYPAVASIVVFEAFRGFPRDKSGQAEARFRAQSDRLQELIGALDVLPFDLAAAEIAAIVFANMNKKQRRDLLLDVLIAATSLSQKCGIATRNRRDFDTIGGCLPQNIGPLYLALW